MKAISIVGPSDSGKTTLIEELVAVLEGEGRVGTIKHLDHAAEIDTAGKDTARHRSAGADVTYGISDREWFATGTDLTLDSAIDRLAPHLDYCLVEGYGESWLPKVALGGRDVAEPVIHRSETASAIDIATLLETIETVEPVVTLSSLVSAIKQADGSDRAGAIATFTGRVRRKDGPADTPTTQLEFEKYDPVAEERMATIRSELCDRTGVFDVRMHHRRGVIEAGEDIVFVVVLAGHRAEAFETVQDGIDRLKAEVPFFKKEVTVEEEYWRHEDPQT